MDTQTGETGSGFLVVRLHERERERERERETETETETERQRQTDRQTETDRQTDRDRQTATERERDVVEVLLYVHRNRRLIIRDGSPGRPPRLSHST